MGFRIFDFTFLGFNGLVLGLGLGLGFWSLEFTIRGLMSMINFFVFLILDRDLGFMVGLGLELMLGLGLQFRFFLRFRVWGK